MPKDIYRLEGSALDVLFNYLEQDKPVPHVISKRALSQWKQYLASEGAHVAGRIIFWFGNTKFCRD